MKSTQDDMKMLGKEVRKSYFKMKMCEDIYKESKARYENIKRTYDYLKKQLNLK